MKLAGKVRRVILSCFVKFPGFRAHPLPGFSKDPRPDFRVRLYEGGGAVGGVGREKPSTPSHGAEAEVSPVYPIVLRVLVARELEPIDWGRSDLDLAEKFPGPIPSLGLVEVGELTQKSQNLVRI